MTYQDRELELLEPLSCYTYLSKAANDVAWVVAYALKNCRHDCNFLTGRKSDVRA